MDKSGLLAQLRDIHLPAPIAFWPGPGWFILLAVAVILMLGFITLRRRRNRAKIQALALLNSYEKDTANSQISSARIAELLKRVALVYYPREQVAGLQGSDWISFLNQSAKGVDFEKVAYLLLELPFKPEENAHMQPLIDQVRLWIKQRKGPCSN